MFANLREQVERQGATLKVLGVGTTGYAKDILKDVLGADVGAGRDRGAHAAGAALLRRRRRHLRRGRAGHQDHHPARTAASRTSS